jgi:hypothetical protein
VSEIEIERISIRVPGLDGDTARRFARLVAEGLVPSLQLGPREGSLERLRVELARRPSEDADALAARLAERLTLLIGETSTVEAGR